MAGSKSHGYSTCDNPNTDSIFKKILRKMGYYHGPECGYNNIDKKYYDVFVQSFAFWKFFLLFFFLLLIGFYNLKTDYEETIDYMKNNGLKFFIELLLLFAAFFIPTLLMYVTRFRMNLLSPMKIIIMAIFLFVFVCLKHISFELSGLYAMKFGNSKCKKEHFGSSSKEDTGKNIVDKCDCMNGTFTGQFWKGSGWYGIALTILLIIFFVVSFVNPNLTKGFFDYEFSRPLSGLYIVLGIIVPLVVSSAFMHKKTNTDECRKIYKKEELDKKNIELRAKNEKEINIDEELNKTDFFGRFRDGCAMVSMVFMTVVSFILPYVLIKWAITKSDKTISAATSIHGPPLSKYGCTMQSRMKNPIFRFGLILVESILIYLIFVLAEAGIETSRKGIPYLEILKDKHFWMLSIPTFIGVFLIQILLEYSTWFEKHLFNDADSTKCVN